MANMIANDCVWSWSQHQPGIATFAGGCVKINGRLERTGIGRVEVQDPYQGKYVLPGAVYDPHLVGEYYFSTTFDGVLWYNGCQYLRASLGQPEWKGASGGKIPEGAIPAGHLPTTVRWPNGEPVFAAKIKREGEQLIGWISLSSTFAQANNFNQRNDVVRSANYEVLCCKFVNPI